MENTYLPVNYVQSQFFFNYLPSPYMVLPNNYGLFPSVFPQTLGLFTNIPPVINFTQAFNPPSENRTLPFAQTQNITETTAKQNQTDGCDKQRGQCLTAPKVIQTLVINSEEQKEFSKSTTKSNRASEIAQQIAVKQLSAEINSVSTRPQKNKRSKKSKHFRVKSSVQIEIDQEKVRLPIKRPTLQKCQKTNLFSRSCLQIPFLQQFLTPTFTKLNISNSLVKSDIGEAKALALCSDYKPNVKPERRFNRN